MRVSYRAWSGGTGKNGGPQRGTVYVREAGAPQPFETTKRRPDVELAVLELLREGPAVVWQLAERLRLPVPAVERSLWALRSLGQATSGPLGSPPIFHWWLEGTP